MESGQHAKEGEHAEVEDSFSREGASQEPDNRFRGGLVELKEALHVLLEVSIDQGDFLIGEDKGGHSREQDGNAVESLNTDTSSRVASVTSCHSSRKEGEDCTSVGRETGEDVGTISVNAPNNAHMFSRFRRDNLGILNLHF